MIAAAFALSLAAELLHALVELLVIDKCTLADTIVVLELAHNLAVDHPGVLAAAAEAFRLLSAGSATSAVMGRLLLIRRKGVLGLTCEGRSISKECLADRITGNLLNGREFVLGLLGGLKNERQFPALMLAGEILLDSVGRIDTAEAGQETIVQAVDELVAEADGKDGIGRNGTGSALEALIIDIHRSGDSLAAGNECLLDVLDSSMRLGRMTRAELVEDCGRDAWSGKLEDLLPDVDLNDFAIDVGVVEIEVGASQHDWAVLEDKI